MIEINERDVIEWANGYSGEKFHACLCDPPYHLTSIVERFGKNGSVPAKDRDGVFQRSSKGFMGKEWDGGDIAFDPETWAALGEHLLPGALGMAFASSRGWHRMAVAIEDAGMIIHPSIFGWVQGCLSEDSEIFTLRGWKKYTDINVGDKTICYNISTDIFSVGNIQEKYIYEYSDTAFHIKSDITDQIVSKNHRCIIEQDGKYIFKKAETLEFKETVPILENMPELFWLFFCGKLRSVLQKNVLFNKMRKGIVVKKGNWNKKGKNEKRVWTLSNTQEKRRNYYVSSLRNKKIQNCSTIEENKDSSNVFQKMFWKIACQESNKVFSSWKKWVECQIGGRISKKNDRRKKSFVERWSYLQETKRKLSKLFYKIYSVPGKIYFYGEKRWLCYGTQTIDCNRDWKATDKIGGSSSHRSQSRKQFFREFDVIQNKSGSQKVRTLWKTKTSLATISPIKYDGVVWCVKVNTGAFIARRNGKMFITGNSGFPKASNPEKVLEKRGEDGSVFDGYRYGAQALKPAIEPIIVFQKPFGNVQIDNILRYGTGVYDIDRNRIGMSVPPTGSGPSHIYGWANTEKEPHWNGSEGRWPANFYLQHEPGCKCIGYRDDQYQINRFVDGAKPWGDAKGEKFDSDEAGGRVLVWECVDGCPIRLLDGQSGNLKSGRFEPHHKITSEWGYHGGERSELPLSNTIGDSGGASRFFFQSHWELEQQDPVFYCAKASRSEKDAGLDAIDKKEVSYSQYRENFKDTKDFVTHYPDGSPRPVNKLRNNHPTVKPLALCKHLAGLLLPPQEYAPRRIMIPFSGSGSEMIGAFQAGWDDIVGIELEKEYIELATARLDYWTVQLPLF